MGEKVLDLVISYMHDVEDRNSVSLVSHKFFETDGITRKRMTVHTFYTNPSRLSTRFPFIESLTLKGPPSCFDYDIQITPWIQQLALEFRCLKELHIRGLVVHDEDLKTLARTCGKDLTSLKINKCKGFSADGLMHVSKYCHQLRNLYLGYPYYIDVKDGIWLRQLALNNTVLERLDVRNRNIDNEEDFSLLIKNCCNSLISLNIGMCYPSKLGDAFRYAVRLDHFGGDIYDQLNEFVNFQLPPNMRSLSITEFVVTPYSIGRPFLNHIRKLKLAFAHEDEDSQCLLFERCPNLEVLHTDYQCGDRIMQVIGEFCKKLRKLTHHGCGKSLTHVGLIALAKGCSKLECLKVLLKDISNKAIKCLGTHLKNLRKLSMDLYKIDLVIDNGIRAMLKGCSKLEKLNIRCEEELTDVGLEYIGKYGTNLRSLSLNLIGNSDAGLVKLSKGCPKLRNLKLRDCPFSKQFVAHSVFNITSLRYVWGYRGSGHDRLFLVLTRPEFQLGNIGRSTLKRKSASQQVTKQRKKGRS